MKTIQNKTEKMEKVNKLSVIYRTITRSQIEPGQCTSVVEHHAMNQEVTSSIPGQGTCQCCGFNPQ